MRPTIQTRCAEDDNQFYGNTCALSESQSETTPAVQFLAISNVPSDIVEAIDELAARQDRSRSSYVRRELQRVIAEYEAKEALVNRDKNRDFYFCGCAARLLE